MKQNLVIIIAIVAVIQQVHCVCDLDNCNNLCTVFSMKGVCDGNVCNCEEGEKCSAMKDLTCNYICDKAGLDGECDKDDGCVCKASIGFCDGILGNCQESCEEDSRSKECLYVQATSCIKYGPIEFCSCLCYVWDPWRLYTMKEKFNYTTSLQEYRKKDIKRPHYLVIKV